MRQHQFLLMVQIVCPFCSRPTEKGIWRWSNVYWKEHTRQARVEIIHYSINLELEFTLFQDPPKVHGKYVLGRILCALFKFFLHENKHLLTPAFPQVFEGPLYHVSQWERIHYSCANWLEQSFGTASFSRHCPCELLCSSSLPDIHSANARHERDRRGWSWCSTNVFAFEREKNRDFCSLFEKLDLSASCRQPQLKLTGPDTAPALPASIFCENAADAGSGKTAEP